MEVADKRLTTALRMHNTEVFEESGAKKMSLTIIDWVIIVGVALYIFVMTHLDRLLWRLGDKAMDRFLKWVADNPHKAAERRRREAERSDEDYCLN
jgi:hypothetical protein